MDWFISQLPAWFPGQENDLSSHRRCFHDGILLVFMTRPGRMITAGTVVCFSKYGLYDFICLLQAFENIILHNTGISCPCLVPKSPKALNTRIACHAFGFQPVWRGILLKVLWGGNAVPVFRAENEEPQYLTANEQGLCLSECNYPDLWPWGNWGSDKKPLGRVLSCQTKNMHGD